MSVFCSPCNSGDHSIGSRGTPSLPICLCFVAPAPVEIIARGQEALQAYQYACEAGTQPVFRTRLMLVGEEGVGKTTLKKALLGIRLVMLVLA